MVLCNLALFPYAICLKCPPFSAEYGMPKRPILLQSLSHNIPHAYLLKNTKVHNQAARPYWKRNNFTSQTDRSCHLA